MELPVILISAVCGDIGYSAVQATRKEVKRIVGCDIRTDSPVSNLLDQFYRVPATSETDRYIDVIINIIKREGVGFFLPVSEPEIKVVNERRGAFECLGVKLLINKPIIVENFLDKFKTVQFLKSIGIQTPKTAILKDYDGSFGFPLIVKPRTGYGSRKVWKIEDSIDLDYICRKDEGGLLVQEYIGTDTDEYTTGVFSDGKTVSSISFKRRLGADGTTIEASLTNEVHLLNLASKLAKAVDLVGSINIQSRRFMNQFIPFEINPRISGTLLFRKEFGFDDLIWWIDVLSGRGYTYSPLYSSGNAIRFYSERYFAMKKA